MEKLGRKREGTYDDVDQDTLTCRALHRLLVPTRPEGHCKHLADNLSEEEGGVCIDSDSARYNKRQCVSVHVECSHAFLDERPFVVFGHAFDCGAAMHVLHCARRSLASCCVRVISDLCDQVQPLHHASMRSRLQLSGIATAQAFLSCLVVSCQACRQYHMRPIAVHVVAAGGNNAMRCRFQCGYDDVGYTSTLAPLGAWESFEYPYTLADLATTVPDTIPAPAQGAYGGAYGGSGCYGSDQHTDAGTYGRFPLGRAPL